MPNAFVSLSVAVDYIATLLEAGDFGTLADATGVKDEPIASGLPTYRDSCLKAIHFLAYVHHGRNFRILYSGREFPDKGETFKLGGHDSELGHVHIDFVRQDDRWKIHKIWQCK